MLSASALAGNNLPQGYNAEVSLIKPGNEAVRYPLQLSESKGKSVALTSQTALPMIIAVDAQTTDNSTLLKVTVTAKEDLYFNFMQTVAVKGSVHNDCQFYMPGFWYRHNLRSPKEAPSFHTSDSWMVREDRLSTPMTGIFDEAKGEYVTVMRRDEFKTEAMSAHKDGNIILDGATSLGFTGFENINGEANLVFGFPYREAPKTYIRKLTLAPAVTAFMKLSKGESKTLTWVITNGKAADFSQFVAQAWTSSFDTNQPKPVALAYTPDFVKETMTNFYRESYMKTRDLTFFSGVGLRTDDCKQVPIAEVGFVGRVLLNAFNALEYGENHNDKALVDIGNSVFDSYLKAGFNYSGFFREFVDYGANYEERHYSIRRQSEGVYAVLNYLAYEKKKGRQHPEWEARIKQILANFLELQNADGSFPRKFDASFQLIDATGGSTPSATLPLVMAYRYFDDNQYLASAKKTGDYLEKELISKADYFSSTLDANCEDKEASLFASTAMYYLALVSEGAQKEHYIAMCKKAAYFCLSWYYTWDVPFAQGQMLGDIGLKTRGWGNVSVENNHIDVFIFEFADVLEWLDKQTVEPRFSAFAGVIRTSMLQLLPYPGHMCGIGKTGFYPEVVQHTNWDYGRNGKGFYNDIFAPGWTVPSLWALLTPHRAEAFLK